MYIYKHINYILNSILLLKRLGHDRKPRQVINFRTFFFTKKKSIRHFYLFLNNLSLQSFQLSTVPRVVNIT